MKKNIILTDKSKELIKDTFLINLTPDNLEKKLHEAYLGILVNDESIFNPLKKVSPLMYEKMPEYIVYLMSQPEYFYFIIKYIFQLDSFPQQCLMLKELYTHRFPLLIGSRGLSKCVDKETYVLTNSGVKQIKDFNIKPIPHIQQNIGNIDFYGEKNYNEVEYGWYNEPKPVKIIHTRSGRKIRCTLNHPLRTVENGEIKWKDAEYLKVGNFLPIQRKYEQWKNTTNINPNVAYMVGAMVGDGCYSVKSSGLGFTNIDKDCIKNVNKGLKEWNSSKLNKIKLTNGKQYQYTVKSNDFQNREIKKSFIETFSTNSYNKAVCKKTPKIIFGAKFESIAAYLSGLFDTDGCCVTNTPMVEFSTKSFELAEETQFLLLVLGINANLRKQFNKKYNKNYYKLQISGTSLRVFRDKVGFRINRKQDILIKHCAKVINDNIDIIPRELILDKLLTVREIARDTVYKTKSNKYGAQCLSKDRLSRYNLSYVKLKEILNKLNESPEASQSYELKLLEEIYNNNYYYDEIVKIEDDNIETYDIHLKGEDHSFISNGFISHNSFTLAVYMLIRMILIPGTKCVITSAGFRQSKVVFDYMENIWKKSLILQNCYKGGKNGPTHGTDVWTFRLGDSITYALPVGPDGSKVRGYRANCLHGDTLISTDKGIVKIKDFKKYNCKQLVNMNHTLESPDSYYSTELTDVYLIKTVNGYSLKCSALHQLYTANGWKLAKELKFGDKVYLDSNEYFPEEYVEYNGKKLDEFNIFGSGLINLSTLTSKEVPWYILQSPKSVVYKYLKLFFGNMWIGQVTKSNSPRKLQDLQILLRKFNFVSKIENDELEVLHQSFINEVEEEIADVIKLDDQDHLYDFELPETNSFCGGGFVNHNCLVTDEFSSINRQVFEEVMSGFLSVAASPVEQIKYSATSALKKRLYIPIPKSDTSGDFIQNQLILSGTAYYKINHFYHYFKKWHDIVSSVNNPKLLKDMFSTDEDAKHINPDDYSIVRIPLELTANGYMDMAQISRIKASTTKDVFLREYSACFSDDSDGFFKKSLIDSCTAEENSKWIYAPALYGSRDKKYVIGVDPAYEGDNFAIVVLEIHGDHRRVVHVWTTQASDHKERLRAGVITENDYYHYCARKIRDLMKRFPCEYIAMDSQGGGKAVMEALTDTTKIKEGEHVILPTIEAEEKPKETDMLPGLHIIKVINFTSEWISLANYALKKDMEDKTIRFPFNDSISYALAEYYDESLGENKELYDTLDDCIYEIEELKKELTTIVVSETTTGREKFDTPSIKVGINKKGRLKKDRYSALLMANYISRDIQIDQERLENPDILNLSGFCLTTNTGKYFRGNSKIADKLNKLYENL